MVITNILKSYFNSNCKTKMERNLQKIFHEKYIVRQIKYTPTSTSQINTSAGINSYIKPYGIKSNQRLF